MKCRFLGLEAYQLLIHPLKMTDKAQKNEMCEVENHPTTEVIVILERSPWFSKESI